MCSAAATAGNLLNLPSKFTQKFNTYIKTLPNMTLILPRNQFLIWPNGEVLTWTFQFEIYFESRGFIIQADGSELGGVESTEYLMVVTYTGARSLFVHTGQFCVIAFLRVPSKVGRTRYHGHLIHLLVPVI